MFLFEMGDDEEYGLKPMNCPGHHATIFDQNNWSYRDLPKRFYENGKVYRKKNNVESFPDFHVYGHLQLMMGICL